MRPWGGGDVGVVFAAFTDPAIRRWHVRTAESVDEVGEWIRGWVADWARGVDAHWAVVDGVGGPVLGRVSLKGMQPEMGHCGVAYWTVPEARGAGVAPRAVSVLAGWAFGIGFHRLELEHSVRNAASCRVAVKAGFVAEGTKRSAGLHEDGWHDMHLHGRVRVG